MLFNVKYTPEFAMVELISNIKRKLTDDQCNSIIRLGSDYGNQSIKS